MGLQVAYFIAGLVVFWLVWFFAIRSSRRSRLNDLRRDDRYFAPRDAFAQKAPNIEWSENQKASRESESSISEDAIEQHAHVAPVMESPKESSVREDNDGVFRKGDAEDLPELDYQIDFVARLPGEQAVLRDDVLRIYQGHQGKISKPTQMYGKEVTTGVWAELEKHDGTARFSDLEASIQLADRQGPVSDHELHQFSQMIRAMGEAFNRSFRFSMDFEDALKQATALDAIGRKFDTMAILNLVSKRRAGFSWEDFATCMNELSLIRSANGVYVKVRLHEGDEQIVMYHVSPTDSSGNISQYSDQSPIRDIVLYMNVPTTVDPDNVFALMVNDANQLQAWLDAKMVDHKGRVMNRKTLAAISTQVSNISRAMAEEGLQPGNPLTIKLFLRGYAGGS